MIPDPTRFVSSSSEGNRSSLNLSALPYTATGAYPQQFGNPPVFWSPPLFAPPPLPVRTQMGLPASNEQHQMQRIPEYKPFGINWATNIVREGMMINILHHQQDCMDNKSLTNENTSVNQTLTRICSWVQSKQRKMIVIELQNQHFVAIAIYTYGGRPVHTKSNRSEFIRVRDADCPNLNARGLDGEHRCIVATRMSKYQELEFGPGNPRYMAPNSYAWFTHPVSVHNTWKFKIHARISQRENMERLKRLACWSCT